jgi:3-mercaptopyruvate sulfurtransferase SseA
MQRHGIQNVSALFGGLEAWRAKGYPIQIGQ